MRGSGWSNNRGVLHNSAIGCSGTTCFAECNGLGNSCKVCDEKDIELAANAIGDFDSFIIGRVKAAVDLGRFGQPAVTQRNSFSDAIVGTPYLGNRGM